MYNAKYNEQRYEYRKKNLKRVPLDLSIEKYQEVKAKADELGEPVNSFIKKAIDDRLKNE